MNRVDSEKTHREAACVSTTGQRFINVVKHSTISTSQLKASRPLHPWPINLVVYEGSHVSEETSKRYLRGGFTLRCIQRLSFRRMATLRCP
jgi:hypothetical protein